MRHTEIIREVVDVADLTVGDTVEVNGKMETVNRNHLTIGFTGNCYKGDPFHNGITKVTFKVPTAYGYRMA